jgi:predicted XRE-type DNA-binding protein
MSENFASLESNTLIIGVFSEEVVCSIFKKETTSFSAIESEKYASDVELVESVKKLINKESLSAANCKQLILVNQTYRSMLVPESLFDKNNLVTFLKFHHHVDEKDYLHYVKIVDSEAYSVFSIPSEMENLLSSKFEKVHYLHHSIPFISSALLNYNKYNTLPEFYLNVTPDFFDILIIRNKKIQLFNSFLYQKNTDAIYFIVNILNLYSYSPNHVKLIISGNVSKEDGFYSGLAKIFNMVELQEASSSVNIEQGLQPIEMQKLIHVFNSVLCV